MLPEEWQRLEEIFQTAADLPPDSQTVYLDSACRGNPQLRREVEAMLAASPLGLIESTIAATADDLIEQNDPLVGTWLGPYRIAGVLGRGGMGAVYRAFREDDQFRKQVAIKVIPRLMAGPDAVARFRSERQILANLEHSNIARLFDGGTSEGIPYLVMEYVEGVPITQYVREKALSVPDCLRLMQSVLSAVLYAHRNLVIHRDLKPANILVTADGIVKLLDFGVAKLADPSAGHVTLTSVMMMTPDYASPEQIRGEAVTTASDVYSLGVVLYEVLTGERPYRITNTNLHELERVVCKTEPRRPSTLEHLPPRRRRRLAGDLDNIVLTALRKDVARRYGSVEQLSEDIRRHLEGLPIRARRDTPWYRGGKFLLRNRWSVAAALLVAASLVSGTVIAIRQQRTAQARFDQLRDFARSLLVDLNAQLIDIPGTVKARQALIAYVDDHLRQAAAVHASDDTALATEFATAYLRLGEIQGPTPEAIASLEKGRLLLERKHRHGPPDPADLLLLARLQVTAGSTRMDLGRSGEAVEDLQAAKSLVSSLRIGWNAEAELLKARADWRLARIYRMQYQLDKAEECSRRAVTICEDLLRHGVRTREMYAIFDGSRNVLAGVLRRVGRWQQGMALYQQVLDDIERRAAEDPSSLSLERDLARQHQVVGDMFARVPGHRPEVRLHVRRAIQIAERLAALDPSDIPAQGELGQYLSSGGETLELDHYLSAGWTTDSGDDEEALRYLRRSLPIFEKILKKEPDDSNIQLYTALAEADLGELLAIRTRSADSISWIRQGFARMSKLVEHDPENTIQYLELLGIQRRLVRALPLVGQGQEALRLGEDLIAREQPVFSQAGGRQELKYDMARSYAAVGDACWEMGKKGDAGKWYRLAIETWQTILKEGHQSPDAESELEEVRLAEQKTRSGRR